MNLLFAAPPEDPVWGDPVAVVLLDEDGEPVDSGLSAGSVAIHAGDSNGTHRVGNLVAELTAGSPEASFSGVEIHYPDRAEPIVRDVGSWRITSGRDARIFEAVEEYGVAYPGCGRIDVVLGSVDGEAAEVIGVDTGAEGVSIADWSASGTGVEGDPVRLGVELSCDDGADLHLLTPRVAVRDAEGRERATTLDPFTIGLTGLEDDDVERIAAR
ncbi:hypothetical protein ACQ3I4_06655 [Zafaria sp. Z1313]|uniref:hypothetical protein n=1 Tax=Zafaria sp. Z1313 TaxID=3423202 RepID=UPI003D303B65